MQDCSTVFWNVHKLVRACDRRELNLTLKISFIQVRVDAELLLPNPNQLYHGRKLYPAAAIPIHLKDPIFSLIMVQRFYSRNKIDGDHLQHYLEKFCNFAAPKVDKTARRKWTCNFTQHFYKEIFFTPAFLVWKAFIYLTNFSSVATPD